MGTDSSDVPAHAAHTAPGGIDDVIARARIASAADNDFLVELMAHVPMEGSLAVATRRDPNFFGLYEISERGTSWLGPLVFGAVVGATNSYRQAILSLIVFFVVGLIILSLTDTDKAIHDAGNALPEEIGRQG